MVHRASYSKIFFGVSQSSILGPVLFDISICDLIFFVSNTNISSYPDANTATYEKLFIVIFIESTVHSFISINYK